MTNKNLKYLWYVTKHRWYVMKFCWEYKLYWQGIVHDWHKFLPVEWYPYVDNFYDDFPEYKDAPTYHKERFGKKYTKEWAQERFDRAWLHHIHLAPHHWQHWILREDDGGIKFIRMPDKYAKEMICDWRGAGMAISGKDDTAAWYKKNIQNIKLHEDTRSFVEKEIGIT